MADDRRHSYQVHPHAAGLRGGHRVMGRTKMGSTVRRVTVDAHAWPIRMLITEAAASWLCTGCKADKGIGAKNLPAGWGYEVDATIALAALAGMSVLISPKRYRKVQREYDKDF